MLVPAAEDMIVPGLNYAQPMQDFEIVADKLSQRECPWNPNAAIVFPKFENLDG